MSKEFSPKRLDVGLFALQEASLSGADADREVLQKYERLAEDWQGLEPQFIEKLAVRWQASGAQRPGQGGTRDAWLHLEAQAHLQQTCQRCLQPVEVPVELTRDYRFVADEATAEREDADCEEDLLVLSRHFNLIELVEDELLMELPLVALHDVCPVQLPTVAVSQGFEAAAGAEQATSGKPDGDAADKPASKPNPFAVLATWKVPPG